MVRSEQDVERLVRQNERLVQLMVNRYLQRRATLDYATRFRLAQQIAGVIVEKAKAHAAGVDVPAPRPEESERFLEDLVAFHQNQ